MFAHQRWNVEGTEEMSPERYQSYLDEVLPRPADYVALRELQRDEGWIAPKKSDMPDAA
jgi:hypothetical protein